MFALLVAHCVNGPRVVSAVAIFGTGTYLLEAGNKFATEKDFYEQLNNAFESAWKAEVVQNESRYALVAGWAMIFVGGLAAQECLNRLVGYFAQPPPVVLSFVQHHLRMDRARTLTHNLQSSHFQFI